MEIRNVGGKGGDPVSMNVRTGCTRLGRLVRCGLGVVLLGLLLLPWYRLVNVRAAGPAVEQTLHLGRLYLGSLWVGSGLATVGTAVLGVLACRARPGSVAVLWSRLGTLLLTPKPATFGLALGLLAAAISLWVSTAVLDGNPVLLDGVSQLVQGRYFAGGMFSGPPLEYPEFWHFQFMILTDSGWTSQYPPGFPAVLAVGLRLGVAWLLGPLLFGLAVYLLSDIAERLYPADRIVARIGVALTALSPFLAFHAAAYMNHVLALVLVTVGMYASLRAVNGSWAWSILTGIAIGGTFATRPYTALVLGFLVTILVWLGAPERRRLTATEWASRLTGAVAGASPFFVGFFLYNRHHFGNSTRFGYLAAEGPGHGLGFHVDPWGDPYGLPEAIGYLSADLLGLSLDLLQTPVPVVVVVALYLILAPRLSRGTVLAATWALFPVAANIFYWHHDLFMGPRLLYEAAPGWCLLLAAAGVGMVRALPERGRGRIAKWMDPRSGLAAVLVMAVTVAAAYSAPGKLLSYRVVAERSGMTLQAPTVERPTLVFVHGSWENRLGARLSALGMRTDSVRRALRYNSTCHVEQYVQGVENGVPHGRPAEAARTELSFDDTTAPPLQELRMPSGSVIRSYENETLVPSCERQAAADFDGVMSLAPLLWQGDLPGLGATGALFVRDFGPERNTRVLNQFPDREPKVLVRRDGKIRLMSYGHGMADLWSQD